MKYSIKDLSLSAFNMENMRNFYSGVFNVQFEAHDIGGGTLYAGTWAGYDFCLVPAELNEVTAQQNRMQFELWVDDIHKAIEAVQAHGGKTNGHLGEDEQVFAIGIYDPDENYMVFKQKK